MTEPLDVWAKANGYPLAREAHGAVLALHPLTFGRWRIVRGDRLGIDDGW